MKTVHVTLSLAMLEIESLMLEGYKSFKLFREGKVWNVIVNGDAK